jgi:signal transduction histidine kinase
MLDKTPATNRAERLRELQQHFSVDLALVTQEEVERRVGRPVSPGDQIPHKVSEREEWYFLVFEDGQSALAAGPVNPSLPKGFAPFGVIVALVGLPLIAGLLALLMERRLTRVERAGHALAAGNLSVRISGKHAAHDELARSFNAMAERVETLIRSRDELVQAVSHELGSPLSRLRFHIELLDNQPEDKRAEKLKAMARDLDVLEELVAELLSYVQSDDHKLNRKAFEPNRGLTDLVELARLEAPEDRLLEVGLELPTDVSVYADQRLFQRAVENVLRNAVQHARAKLLLELTQEEDHVRVAVHDDGPGIPEDLQEKVKMPFFRLQADRGRRTGGAGLGLAIANRILQRHGGRLSIARSPFGGATVAMLWPRNY